MDFLMEYYGIYFLLIPVSILTCIMWHLICRRKSISIFRLALGIPITLIFDGIIVLAGYRSLSDFFGGGISVIALLLGGIIPIFAERILNAEKNVIWSFLRRNSWGSLIFLFLVLDFMFNKSENLKPWGSCWYGVDYSMGIGSRFLVGTVLQILTGGRVSTGIAYFCCETALLFLILLVAILANAVIRRAEKGEKKAIIFLVLCFLSSPGSVAGMWTDGNMGRMETYTLLCCLLAVIIFYKAKRGVIRYAGITLLSVISMAVYQGYIFLYYPIIFVLIICDVFKDRQWQWKRIAGGVISCLITAGSFLLFQFGSYTYFEDAHQMAEAIRQRTDLNVKEAAIHYEFFASVSEAYNELNKVFLTGAEYPREKTLLLCIIMLPLIAIILALYGKCLKEVKTKYGKKAILNSPYFYCILVNLAVLPQFLLNVDWGRWMIAITINLFFQVLYLYHAGFPEMKIAMTKLQIFIENNTALAIICVLYLTIFNKFEDRFYFEQIERFFG